MKSESSTVTFDMVTLPVFVATNEYVIVFPAVKVDSLVTFADLTTPIDATGVTGTITVDGVSGTTGSPPPGGLPVAVAVLDRFPASTSAWVTV
ncbi:conserved hypothetical protein [Sphingobacterium multivorum]|uniref:Uncharacterized protein n=1 Tax=Sphingobacterium multivorum TaxID=28454 RepID=A0A654B655_SPHMU|nr:conserved hypothetical protein [Sphingobacterium multivorum]